MCDRYLHCPSCGAELTAAFVVAGDNATGFYMEFFLLPADGGAFVQAVDKGGTVTGGAAVPTIDASVLAEHELVQAFPNERGFDDDEAPSPPVRRP